MRTFTDFSIDRIATVLYKKEADGLAKGKTIEDYKKEFIEALQRSREYERAKGMFANLLTRFFMSYTAYSELLYGIELTCRYLENQHGRDVRGSCSIMLLLGIIVAQKVNRDRPYKTASFSTVLQNIINFKLILPSLEIGFLETIDYKVYISREKMLDVLKKFH